MSVAPPRHTKFREAAQPLFMSAALEPKADSFEVLAARLISGITERGGGDISTALALLYVIGCLTSVSNPRQDYPAGPDGRRPSTREAGAGRGPSPDGRPKDYVHLHFLSANRDPSVWTDPDRLDIHRERRPHLALGPAVTHASA